jgi:esterase/lipase
VLALNYQGVGASVGRAALTVAEMARDTIAFVRALGFEQVDLLGFSLGGFVAQDIVLKEPELVRKVILTGTGPARGEGIDKVGPVSWPLIIKGVLTLRDPKFYLFFTTTANGRRAAKAFLERLKERKAMRDRPITMSAFLRQLKAIKAWGTQASQELGAILKPVLVANGDQNKMVPSRSAFTLAKLRPSPSSIASRPVSACQRATMTSTYRGSSSSSRATRPVRSAAIRVVPLPPNGSSTSPPCGLELRIARSTSPTGFFVGCRSLRLGRSMNQASPSSRAPHPWWLTPSGQP